MSAQTLVELLYRKGVLLSVKDGSLLIDAPDDVLTDELFLQLKQYKKEVIELIKKLEYSRARPKKHSYPSSYKCAASLAQQRMLFMEELAGYSSYYNIPIVYKITGHLNKIALLKSFTRLISRHDVLRTVYVFEDNIYVQHISKSADPLINEVSLLNELDKDHILSVLLEQDAHHIFNLSCDWPIKISLFKYEENEYFLSINLHHIAADGWSARNIFSELATGYQLYQHQIELSDIELGYQYSDYVQWQMEWQNSQHFQLAKNYWTTSLKGMPQLHSLPIDFIRPSIQSVLGNTYTQIIPASQMMKLELCARRFKTTSFVIFQAVFASFLARYSGESDIVFATAAANRQPLEFIDTVGLFVNTLVLRHTISDDFSFSDMILQAIDVSSQAFRFQQFPFDALVDELQPARSLGYNPLVQIMLVMQESLDAGMTLDGVQVTHIKQQQKVSKFDLALHIFCDKNQISINWEYSTSIFKLATIQAMASHFRCLFDACLSAPEKKVHSIPLVAAEFSFAPINISDFPSPNCVHILFERQVALNPENIAVCEGEKALTYQELNMHANSVANHLYAIDGGNGGRIGICMEKSSELLVGLLAIMKIGAVYVPLDPYYPKERLDWMIRDSGISILLTSSDTELPKNLDAIAKVFSIQTLLNSDMALPYASHDEVDAPAYIIYTSGSTGKPKGVLVSQRSLFYSLHTNRSLMAIGQHDFMPMIGSQAFGVSLLEILLPLISGGKVLVLKKSQIQNMEQLILATNDVTVLHAVPSLMHQWIDMVLLADNPDQYLQLRLLLVGGESVPESLLEKIKQWRPHIRLLELYGMTESTVVCSSYAANQESHKYYCIGKPHPHTHFYVLSRQGCQQPVGVPGELHIGSLSLATKYINQPEMTDERFIENPFVVGERLYKTGDLVRLLHDGHYEFLGRVDHQVSLRGARIELGEIETLVARVAGVKQVVAFVATLGEDEKTLAVYYTTDSEITNYENLSEIIRTYLAQYIPDYMRPSIIQRLEKFSLNPNGKIDRKRLPEPDFIKVIIAPETEIEKRLAGLWQTVLQCDSVSVNANFFEVGGHSLMATKLATQIRTAFAISLPLAVLFESPTIRSCAKVIEKSIEEKYAQSLIQKNIDCGAEEGEELFL